MKTATDGIHLDGRTDAQRNEARRVSPVYRLRFLLVPFVLFATPAPDSPSAVGQTYAPWTSLASSVPAAANSARALDAPTAMAGGGTTANRPASIEPEPDDIRHAEPPAASPDRDEPSATPVVAPAARLVVSDLWDVGRFDFHAEEATDPGGMPSVREADDSTAAVSPDAASPAPGGERSTPDNGPIVAKAAQVEISEAGEVAADADTSVALEPTPDVAPPVDPETSPPVENTSVETGSVGVPFRLAAAYGPHPEDDYLDGAGVTLEPAPDDPGVQPERGMPVSMETTAEFASQDPFIRAVQIVERAGQRIAVTVNQTATIDVARPVDSATIANPEVAVVNVETPTRVVVTGVGVGSTQLRIQAGQTQRVLDITVERDLSALRDLIRAISPASEVELHSIAGTIIVGGRVPDSETAERIIELAGLVQGTGDVRNQLDVAGVQQTLLRVVVAEVNKDATRRLGVNWAIGASDLSRDFFFANNLNQINPTVFGSTGLPNVLQGQQLFSVAPVANGIGTNVTFGFPRAEFQMFINALRENSLFRVLAEPNLVSLSGQTATFLAGGEVPIPVTQGGAVAGAITIEFHEFGVRLAFTPTILSGQRIRLHVMVEVSDAVPGTAIAGGLPVFSFTTRRVESTIECGNGQTFAIAGLLSESVSAVASKIPGLGDIPILGALFSSVDYQKSNTELVILVTPQLIEPLEPHQVAPPPGSLMTHPNDYELFALQKLESEPRPWPQRQGAPRDELPVNTRPGGSNWPTTQLTLHGPWGLAAYEERR